MAATVSAWGKPGAWALDSEQHEKEEEEQVNQKEEEDAKKKMKDLLFAPSQPLSDFPSLSAAVTTKTKKKKPQAVSLSEFTTGKPVSYGSANTLTHNELLSLPTGPRERSAEELERSSTRLGGGFRSYGSSSSSSDHPRGGGGGGGGGREDYSSRWGRSGSDSTDEPRRNSNREPAPPSKADEVHDWGAAKKSSAAVGGGHPSSFDRRDRDRGSGAGFFDSHSRADESDSWLSKKSLPPSEPTRRFDRDRRGVSFEKESSNVSGGGAHSDNWNTKRGGELPVSENGRPKLVLQPRSQAPTGGDPAVVANKTNPFGEARPREQVLADKGQDWKKIDEQLESTKVKETTSVLNDGSTTFGKKTFGNGRLSSPEDRDRIEKSWRKTISENSPPSSEVEADKDGDAVESEN